MNLKYIFSVIIGGVLIIGAGASCQKKTDCKLTVKTTDSAGAVLGNSTVKVFANVKTSSGSTVEADLKATAVSDGSGNAIFTFKLPAILDVQVVGSNGKKGVGIVKLEEGKNVDKTISVK